MKVLTTATPGSAEWLGARKGKIGGTAAVNIICGDDPSIRTFGTPLTEWMRLTGRTSNDDKELDADPELKAILRWGRKSEPLHRALLEEDTGGFAEGPPGVVQHESIDWFAVSPDGFLTVDGVRHVLETKAPTQWTVDEWDEGPPVAYQVQVAACMYVLGEEHGIVSALIPPAPRWGRVARDAAFERFMLDKLGHFMDYHVAKDIQPIATGKALDKRVLFNLHPKDNGESIELLPELAATFDALERDQAEQKLLVGRIEASKNRIAQAIGPNTEGSCGAFRATYKWTSRSAHTVKASEFRVLRTSRI